MDRASREKIVKSIEVNTIELVVTMSHLKFWFRNFR